MWNTEEEEVMFWHRIRGDWNHKYPTGRSGKWRKPGKQEESIRHNERGEAKLNTMHMR